MDESQALLGTDTGADGCVVRHRARQRHRGSYDKYNADEADEGSSSDGSGGWWADSQSSCSSSCSASQSVSSVEWESKVNVNGELFYIEPDTSNQEEIFPASPVLTDKDESDKLHLNKKGQTGKLARWMRRREIKQLDKESRNRNVGLAVGAAVNRLTSPGDKVRSIALWVHDKPTGDSGLALSLLGLKVVAGTEDQVFIAQVGSGPAQHKQDILTGCWLKCVGREEVTMGNLDSVLAALALPSEVVVKVQRVADAERVEQPCASMAQTLTSRSPQLDMVLEKQLVGLAFINMDSVSAPDSDGLIYSYPVNSFIRTSRGSFVTLYHLLSEIQAGVSQCMSSSVLIHNQLAHVIYLVEGQFLCLFLVPDLRCSVREASDITMDLIRCLCFNHQTLSRCFGKTSHHDLDHFFSLFFSRLLTSGFALDGVLKTSIENVAASAQETCQPHFEDILPAASWVPLPKELQLQIDDALNELEANGAEQRGDAPRRYIVLGSCLYHRGSLLASHLPKDDLLDVNSFCRQNGLLGLMRHEPVRSLVVWREVFPTSVNRGLPSQRATVYPVPCGRWFLLLVGQGCDMLAVILEAGVCCAPTEGSGSAGPEPVYVTEAEETLRHIRRLGITRRTSQWIQDNVRAKTVTPVQVLSRTNKAKKDNLLGLVRSLDNSPRSPGKAEGMFGSKRRGSQELHGHYTQAADVTEDTMSQATSNLSEVSDESAPILGRRAERTRTAVHVSDESDDTDSDWESCRDGTTSEGNDSLRGYVRGLEEVVASKLTSGHENVLFHYVHLDAGEGVVMSSTVNGTSAMKQILASFRHSAQAIHSLLDNNIRFKKTSHEDSKTVINKSLIAVKEHGVLMEHSLPESEGRKSAILTYWVVGRLFFTPHPREVYICYHDSTPQNLVEIAFRLGLMAAG